VKKIYLFCNAGMSTSLLASKMKKYAEENNIDVDIKAFNSSNIESIMEEFNPDVILLGPQVKPLYNPINNKYGSDHIVEIIDQTDYGMLNGSKVLSHVLTLLDK